MFDALRGVWDRRKAWSRALVRFAFLLATLGALGACAHAFEVAPGYSIKEIPYAGAPLAWIDNESVLFNGAKRKGLSESAIHEGWGESALYSWNTHTGKVTELMKIGPLADLCFDRGYLYEAFYRNGDRIIREGPLGKEKETVIRKGTLRAKDLTLNRHSCVWQKWPEPTQKDRGIIEVLRKDHGFIEAERPWDPFPSRQYFIVPPSRKPIPIDFHGASGAPRYSAFKGAYAFQESISGWGANLGLKYWLIYPDGRVELTQIPPGEWRTGAVYAMPVRNGWFMSSLSMTDTAAGGYIVDGANVKLVFNGLIKAFAVSPNGCLVAFGGQPSGGVTPRNAVLDLCGN
ncbi:MAG: hypothetical protein WCA17_12925, partial [Burkholderiales bacterium]